MNNVVAFIGKPNSGKSTIFNRIIGERVSIVEDSPGVTRDRIYAKCSWLGKEFRVIDTGGIELKDATFQEQIKMQAQIAIDEASLIVYIVDGRSGVTADDKYISSMLKKSKKKVILAVNKIDDGSLKNSIYEFYSLGIGEPMPVSGIHGIGIGDLLDAIISNIEVEEKVENENKIKFSLIGRPNVGKSSLVNAILNEERVIISDIAGTTRDAIDTEFTIEDIEYTVIDTAGLKKRGKIYESIDKYAAIRSLDAIDRSDVVCVVIDAKEGILEQDRHVAGYAYEAGKAIVLVVNKWDAIEKDDRSSIKFEKDIRDRFKFLSFAPIVFVSAVTKLRINKLIEKIGYVFDNASRRIPTSVLNEVVLGAVLKTPPVEFNGGIIKILYANQVSTKPPLFVIFVNDSTFLHFSYRRYLENRIRESFDFEGTPIRIKLKEKS